ncbi:MAG TPA: hypothetical protein VMI33_02655 [Streptosporangiaceae bacterium]|nr:hypothetical protein [Streptosporangiaceae bacterium]
MTLATNPRHRRRAAANSGGAAGNERLTAMTGAVLLALFAAEGLTILRIHRLLTLHFFLGMLLLGPVALKCASTGYRFARYYTGSGPYVRKGPPALPMRLLGPLVMATSLGVLGTGVMLAVVGPGNGQWLFLHKATFAAWFGAMTIHVLVYAPRLPRLLAGPVARRTAAVIGGRGARWLLLAGALACGLLIALATVHLTGRWENGFIGG